MWRMRVLILGFVFVVVNVAPRSVTPPAADHVHRRDVFAPATTAGMPIVIVLPAAAAIPEQQRR